MRKPSLHLRSIELHAERASSSRSFPFTVPAIRSLPRVELTAPVTFFVGDNGSGKSTLLEAIAAAARLPAVGSEEVDRDQTLAHQRQLAHALKLTWNRRAVRGFFLRAEDFFGFAKRIARLRAELNERVGDVETEFADATPYTRGLAAGPALASLMALEQLYGDGLDARSHGEAFLQLFESRLRPGGLYLLDEPEAALSPQSQLAMIALIADSVRSGARDSGRAASGRLRSDAESQPRRAGSQFVIATHSPILLAYPGAVIYSFDSLPLAAVSYDELEHVTLTRDFLNAPHRYLHRLVSGPNATDA